MIISVVYILLFALVDNVLAKTWTYTWDITWVWANPDGKFSRPVMGINNQWPNPLINITAGDRLVVHVTNKLGNETTGLHWHGFFQNGTNVMDGPRGATGCPIPPGGCFTYDFIVHQPGSFWYHSHDIAQYPDGLRGPLIVQDPSNPYAGQYDAELVITVSDWYHDQMPKLASKYLLLSGNSDGNEPEPHSALINDGRDTKIHVQPGLTYYIHLINMGAFSQFWFQIDQHPFTIVAADGTYVQKTPVQNCFLAVGQRYGLLMKTKPTASRNYAILGSMDDAMYDEIPSYVNPNVTGHLVYNQKAKLPPAPVVPADQFSIFDDFKLTPLDSQPNLGKPDHTIVMDLNIIGEDGQNRGTWNNITYLEQKVPTLMTAMSAGKYATSPKIYGVNANAHVLGYGKVIELVVNNYDGGYHPIHVHGHAPQLIYRSEVGHFQPGDPIPSNPIPMRRDTWLVNPNGTTISRFVSDNPGVWLVHCHMDWHFIGGLAFSLIEAPLQLQATQTIPQQANSLCQAQGTATAGNAAGNTRNFFDLRGAVTKPNPRPKGAIP